MTNFELQRAYAAVRAVVAMDSRHAVPSSSDHSRGLEAVRGHDIKAAISPLSFLLIPEAFLVGDQLLQSL